MTQAEMLNKTGAKKGLFVDIIKELIKDVPLPRMVKIRQRFNADEIVDVAATFRTALIDSGQLDRIKPGMRIAIAAGSRGVDQISLLMRMLVVELQKRGADPFIIPAMGSHGGATAEGQADVLAHLGITEKTMNCLIVSSMEVVEISLVPDGLPVYMDKTAYHSDGIIVINRV